MNSKKVEVKVEWCTADNKETLQKQSYKENENLEHMVLRQGGQQSYWLV